MTIELTLGICFDISETSGRLTLFRAVFGVQHAQFGCAEVNMSHIHSKSFCAYLLNIPMWARSRPDVRGS